MNTKQMAVLEDVKNSICPVCKKNCILILLNGEESGENESFPICDNPQPMQLSITWSCNLCGADTVVHYQAVGAENPWD